ncbi:MAG: right-handed parallel beta-helix repeat-containing protein [Fibrobacterota bacterium]
MKIKKLLFPVFLLSSLIFSETIVNGVLTESVKWFRKDGPFIINDDLVIPRKVSLTIEKGTEVFIYPKPKNIVSSSQGPIKQINSRDSSLVSIKVFGGLRCAGSYAKRITFKTFSGNGKTSEEKENKSASPGWYGIYLNNADNDNTILSFTDFKGALYSVQIEECSPIIKNCSFTENYTAIYLNGKSKSQITNNVICDNHFVGILNANSSPRIAYNIICDNGAHGIWSDMVSAMNIEYNCFSGNTDSNLENCDYRYGKLEKTNHNGDSVDFKDNLFKNPVFYGSDKHIELHKKDLKVPTDSAEATDPNLAREINKRSSREYKPSGVPKI